MFNTSNFQSAFFFRSEDCRAGGWRFDWALHCYVVSLDRKLRPTLSLFTQVWRNTAGGNPAMDLVTSDPERLQYSRDELHKT